jgi:glucose/arabinose dehydrogenase
MIDTETKEVSDFATGWLTDKEKVLGRPVDIIFDKEGVMYVSDDNAGLIYRVSSKG